MGEILEPYVRLQRSLCPIVNFFLMDINAYPHKAGQDNEYFENEDIQKIEWLARSPALNLIECRWDALGRAVAACHAPPRTLSVLRSTMLRECDLLPPNFYSLINNMRACCDACVAIRDDHTS